MGIPNLQQHQQYIKRAISLARKGKEGNGGAFGAVIVRNGEIIAEGYNLVKQQKDCTQHAELLVIQKTCKTLNS